MNTRIVKAYINLLGIADEVETNYDEEIGKYIKKYADILMGELMKKKKTNTKRG